MTDQTAYIGEIQKNQSRKSAKQNKYFKSEAKKTLFSGDNLYKAVISHLICGMVSSSFLYMAFYVPDLCYIFFGDFLSQLSVGLISTVVRVTLYVLSSFFFFAFSFGIYTLASDMKSEPDREPGAPSPSSMARMLDPLKSFYSFGRTLAVFLILAAELTVSVLPSVFVFLFADAAGLDKFSAVTVEIICVLCSAFACAFFLSLLVPLPYVIKEDERVGAFTAYKKSAKAALCGIWRVYALMFSFIPLLLLSAVTCGILFFAFVYPYMSIALSKVGEYLYYIENPERRHINE